MRPVTRYLEPRKESLLEREVRTGTLLIRDAASLTPYMEYECYKNDKHSYKIETSDQSYIHYKCQHCGVFHYQQKTTQKVWSRNAKR